VLFVCAEEIVDIVLGPQWHGAIPIFRILSLVCLIYATNVSLGWVYISLGRTDKQLRWELFAAPTRILGMSVGVYWGVIGVAWSVTLTMAMLYLPSRWYCFKDSPIDLRIFFTAIARPMLASIMAGGCALCVSLAPAITEHGSLLLLASKLAVFALAYPLALSLLPGGSALISDVMRSAQAIAVLRNRREEK